MAKVLANQFGTLEHVIAATEDDLLQVHEIGPETAHSVVTFFAEPRNLAVLNQMKERKNMLYSIPFMEEE